MTTSREVRTFVFFDLETTGLPSPGSFPRITELSMVAVHRTELVCPVLPHRLPRVQNKLTLCLNPQKPIEPHVTHITGLDSNNLFYQKDFDENALISIESFLQRLDPPVCLLAHNGNKFDFGLLLVELQLHQRQSCEGILCADTLLAFQAADEKKLKTVTEILQKPQTVVEAQFPQPGLFSHETPSHGRFNLKKNTKFIQQPAYDFAMVKQSAVRKRLVFADSDDEKDNSSGKAIKLGTESSASDKQEHRVSVTEPDQVENMEEKMEKKDNHEVVSDISLQNEVTAGASGQESKQSNGQCTDVDRAEFTCGGEIQESNEAKSKLPHTKREGTESGSNGEQENNDTGEEPQEEHTPSYGMSQDTLEYALSDWSQDETESHGDTKMHGGTQGEQASGTKSQKMDEVSDQDLVGMSSCSESTQSQSEINKSQSHCETVRANPTGRELSSGVKLMKMGTYWTTHASADEVTDQDLLNIPSCPDESGDSVNIESTEVYVSPGSDQSGKQTHQHIISTDSNQDAATGNLDVESEAFGKQNYDAVITATGQNTPISSEDTNGIPRRQLFPDENGSKVSYSLREIYRREFGTYPEQSHRAEDDCMALLKVVMSRANEMLPWFDANAVPLVTMPLMYQLPPVRSPLPIDKFPYQLDLPFSEDEAVHQLV